MHSLTINTVTTGFCDHPPSEGSRSLKPARPLKQEAGYSDQVVAKARVWVELIVEKIPTASPPVTKSGSFTAMSTSETLVDLEVEETKPATQLGLGGPRLGGRGPVQVTQSPSKRLRLGPNTNEETPKLTRAASSATFHGCTDVIDE